jgi:hypothetical protein
MAGRIAGHIRRPFGRRSGANSRQSIQIEKGKYFALIFS